jgi:DNA ligase 1
MQTVKSSEWLITKNKKDLNKYWRLHILQDGDRFYTQTEWYSTTTTGKATTTQFSDPYYCPPTNVGRSNHRNSSQQAHFDFDSMIKKVRDKGGRYEGEELEVRPMPMLAHKFADHTTKVGFPAYVQPKLNGMRMLFDGQNGWSRGNKDVLPEVVEHLKFNTGGYVLDGELMLPGNVLLQESMSAIKKYRSGVSDQLVYHVYDVVMEGVEYVDRLNIIMDIMKVAPPNVVMVPTAVALHEHDVYTLHGGYTDGGYEGTMVRTVDGLYEIGKRSYGLLKFKDFRDDEYVIVDVIEGSGGDEGLAIFVLSTPSGGIFNCRPEGSQENRRALYNERHTLIGKYMTVRYFELSKDLIPIFPVGVGIRDVGEFGEA